MVADKPKVGDLVKCRKTDPPCPWYWDGWGVVVKVSKNTITLDDFYHSLDSLLTVITPSGKRRVVSKRWLEEL